MVMRQHTRLFVTCYYGQLKPLQKIHIGSSQQHRRNSQTPQLLVDMSFQIFPMFQTLQMTRTILPSSLHTYQPIQLLQYRNLSPHRILTIPVSLTSLPIVVHSLAMELVQLITVFISISSNRKGSNFLLPIFTRKTCLRLRHRHRHHIRPHLPRHVVPPHSHVSTRNQNPCWFVRDFRIMCASGLQCPLMITLTTICPSPLASFVPWRSILVSRKISSMLVMKIWLSRAAQICTP